ncbi:unannotated protein [freshwater metagenome]|uniref:Unannotated protein n=1 Tax=freshwater metagenome TaxID=449393 RepID=A0A6J7VA38_9ZZZZ|nr:alpha/beta fold hydrolase [Actinomycetota bacterium]
MSEDRSVFELPTRQPDSTLVYGEDPSQIADIFGSPKSPALVLIHGGYWRPQYDRVHVRPLAGALADAGYFVISLEYRRIPGNPDAMVADVAAAIAAIPAESVTLIGHSAGGHLALWAAANVSKVRKVVALAPVSDLQMTEDLHLDEGAATDFLGCPASTRTDLDPMYLEYGDVEVLVVQGDCDIRVPVEMNRKFAMHQPQVKYQEHPGIGHFEVIDPTSSIWLELIQSI